MANKSRKANLIRVLEDAGNLAGIECFRTPGEEAAIRIALKLIERTSLKDLDAVAARVKEASPFWDKQW